MFQIAAVTQTALVDATRTLATSANAHAKVASQHSFTLIFD